ncbi:MAG: hypothetical protein K8R75_06290 [Deltaproteobacteria bacterium]|nr:hypothetical protein [Deltaproteobacteria bacterium]
MATLRLRQAGYGLCSGLVSQSQASPISSRALPGTQQYRFSYLFYRLHLLAEKPVEHDGHQRNNDQ